MANPFDQFDAPQGNAFDKFDDQKKTSAKKPEAIEPPTWIEQQLAKLPSMSSKTENQLRGFAMGAADPSVGLFQLGANILGQGESAPTLSGLVTGKKSGINQAIADKEAQYEADRKASGREGFDASRMAGNVAAPANLIAAAKLQPLLKGGMAAQGVQMGAIGGASSPVVSPEDYFTQKAGQTAIGAVAGGVLTPVMGKLGEAVAKRMQAANVDPAQVAQQTDAQIAQALKEVGQSITDINPQTLQTLRQQVTESLKNGKSLDAAAALRKADFDSLGMPSLQGQITRDSNQFAKEMNLRGVSNLGEQIQQRMDQQAQILQGKVGSFAEGAVERYPAGAKLSDSLSETDQALKSHINDLYGKAKDHLGRAAPMDSAAFSTQANAALDGEMLGSVLPATARSILNDVTMGKIPFNVNTAVQIDRTLSALQRSGTQAEALAIGKVRTALNNAPIADNVGEDAKKAFDIARAAAKERFDMHDAIPALKAAANGKVAPDDFVKRFVLQGKTEEVQNLAGLLKKSDPSAYDQARAQIGESLKNAAFGNNAANDKTMAAERFGKALKDIGTDKLKAFFTSSEIDELNALARVAAYKGSTPSNAAVNYSNSASAFMNLLGRVPGIPAVVSVANAAKRSIDDGSVVKRAVSDVVPSRRADISPEMKNRLAQLLGGGALVSGEISGESVRK